MGNKSIEQKPEKLKLKKQTEPGFSKIIRQNNWKQQLRDNNIQISTENTEKTNKMKSGSEQPTDHRYLIMKARTKVNDASIIVGNLRKII